MIAILLSRFGQIILSFISVKLATSILSTEAYGQISLFLALFSAFSLTFINPVGMFFNRKFHSWVQNGKIKYYFLLYIIHLLIVSLLAAVFCISASYFGISFIKNISVYWIVLIICSGLIFTTSNLIFISFVNLLGKRGWFALLTFNTALAALLVSLILVYYIAPTAEYWQLGQVIGQAVIGIYAAWLFVKLAFNKATVVDKLSKANLQNILVFAIPIAISVGLTWVQTQSYRFVVGEKIGLAALGLFYAGYNIGSVIITTFETVITNYFLPKFYQEVSTADSKKYEVIWQKYASSVLPTLFLTTVFIIIFSSELTRLLLSDKFQIAARYVMWGALAETGRVVVSTFAYMAHAKMNTKALIIPNIVGALIALLLVVLLIPIFGINAVGCSLVLASVAVIIIMQITVMKGIPLSLYWRNLMKSACYSVLLLLLVMGVRKMFPLSLNFINAAGVIMGFGIVYLLLAYNLLHDEMKA